jgi:predicted P-loop ATPase
MSEADQSGEKPPLPATPIVDLEAEKAKRWLRLLLRVGGSTSKVRKVSANAIIALRHAPEWKDALSFDASAYIVLLNRAPPKPWKHVKHFRPHVWDEQDDRLLAEWLQRKGIDLHSSVVADAVETVARERSFHPIRDYLAGLTWDGTARMDKWLHAYAGAEDTLLNSAFGSKWLIAAVARALIPGCKVDTMLILEGVQGIGKSTLLRELCGRDWFTDKLGDNLGDKDAAMTISGKWIVECAELEALGTSTVERLKAFLSREVDRYRPPYGRRAIDSKRQCVFAGTTNNLEYLRDMAGNRRYWPVRCKDRDCDVAGVVRDRDQLWAEAKFRFEQGENWWLTGEMQKLQAEQAEERMELDPWEEIILAGITEKVEVRIKEIATKLLGIAECDLSKSDQRRIGAILRHHKFERVVRREGKVQYKAFVRNQ